MTLRSLPGNLILRSSRRNAASEGQSEGPSSCLTTNLRRSSLKKSWTTTRTFGR